MASLYDYLPPKTELLAALAEHIKPGVNDVEAMRAPAAKAVREIAAEALAQSALADLTDRLDVYEAINGACPASGDAGFFEWDSGLDDEIERWLEAYQTQVSVDWLGQATDRIDVTTEGGPLNMARSLGGEIVKQMCHDIATGTVKSDAKILSAAGLVDKDLAKVKGAKVARKGGRPPKAKAEPDSTPIGCPAGIMGIIARFAADTALPADQLRLLLDEASGDDKDLAANALRLLGVIGVDVMETAVDELTVNRAMNGLDELVAMMQQAITDISAATIATEQSKPAKAKAPPMPIDILVSIRDHGGMTDKQMAETIGVSRPGYNLYINGHQEFRPDSEQVEAMRSLVAGKVAALTAVLGRLG